MNTITETYKVPGCLLDSESKTTDGEKLIVPGLVEIETSDLAQAILQHYRF